MTSALSSVSSNASAPALELLPQQKMRIRISKVAQEISNTYPNTPVPMDLDLEKYDPVTNTFVSYSINELREVYFGLTAEQLRRQRSRSGL